MDSHDLENLRELLRDGRKTEAIAAVRSLENVDLKQALDIVKAVERGEGLVAVSAMVGHTAAPAAGGVDQGLLDAVQQALAQRQKIAAIKIWRERTGAGLKEAKEAVEAIERGQPPKMSAAPAPTLDSGGLEAVKDALRQGKKIQAIKLYRELKGVGLREAKDAVESMGF